MTRQRRAAAAAVVLAASTMLSATGCTEDEDHTPHLRVEVIAAHPHDRNAFTEGLEIDGTTRYESTGMKGRSGVTATDMVTGAPIASATLPGALFGEGVTLAGATLWQLTWKDETAFARDPRTLAEKRQVPYDGEGWGLCARQGRVVMSDGSDTLTFRDPDTFAVTGSVRLTSHHSAQLNELDCAADGSVYANVWPTDHILRIDPATGAVLGDIDAGGLLKPTERAGTDVLNGIAQLPGTDHFLITGKYWPTLFEVRFVPA